MGYGTVNIGARNHVSVFFILMFCLICIWKEKCRIWDCSVKVERSCPSLDPQHIQTCVCLVLICPASSKYLVIWRLTFCSANHSHTKMCHSYSTLDHSMIEICITIKALKLWEGGFSFVGLQNVTLSRLLVFLYWEKSKIL